MKKGNIVKICIPAENDLGMDAQVCDHFGSAPFFVIVETGTDTCEVISNRNDHHEHGQCMPVQQLGTFGLDGLVCRGMGRNALARFTSIGIEVFTTRSQTVGEILEEARTGRLQPLDANQACAGHRGTIS